MIWNPWAEYAKEIPDFGDDEFPNMVCVEAGRVAAPIVLLPGTAFEASQILQVGRLFISGNFCSPGTAKGEISRLFMISINIDGFARILDYIIMSKTPIVERFR